MREKVPTAESKWDVQPAHSSISQRSVHNDSISSDDDVRSIVHDVVNSPGQTLDSATRDSMESRIGYDFSHVRVHTDTRAAQSARAVNALAYTTGCNVVFGAGQYAPSTHSGRKLLAHELTHVVQQGVRSSGVIVPDVINPQSDALEREADHVADKLIFNERTMPAMEFNNHRTASGNYVSGYAAPLDRKSPPAVKISARMNSPSLQRQPIPVKGSPVPLAGPYSGLHPFPAPPPPPPSKLPKLIKDLTDLIQNATWKEIRKRVYPKESAAGIRRAKERHAGTRPDLTGLGSLRRLDHFAAAVHSIQGRWRRLSVDQRVNELGAAANTELTTADVPGFLAFHKQPMEFKGFFTPSDWTFTISEALVTGSTLGNTDAADVANTTMHESRHAEQHFLAARFSAGVNKKDGTAIATELGIPKVIADQAVAKKFNTGTNPSVVALGRRMFQANVTDKARNDAIESDDGIADMARMRTEAQVALINLKAGATAKTISEAEAKRDALRAQILVVEHKYTLYRNIPYEADAHEVGDAEALAFQGWPSP